MARGYSKTIVCGHVGGDPDIRFTGKGTAVAVFSIAVTDVWKDKVSGDRKEHTEWYRIKLFGRRAEIAREYVHKGSLVLVEAKKRSERYTDKDGIERYSDEFVGDDIKLLDAAKDGAAGESPADDHAGDES